MKPLREGKISLMWGHHLSLLDSYEYLSDPAGWFTKSEHWSLDGA